ncbi:MAG: hypothetical protein H6686_11410 [Fibrobacteria bacterium]|nr:hypothetical protein [Fibrobacteria bacterium]
MLLATWVLTAGAAPESGAPGNPSLAARLDSLALATIEGHGLRTTHDSVVLFGVRTNGPDTKNGRWACAKVASVVLRRAGAMPKVVLAVRDVERALSKWTPITSEDSLRPGDVVVWTRRFDAPANGACIGGGTCHVGIVTSRGYFHNDPLRKQPTLGGLSLLAFQFKAGYRGR